MNDTTLHLLRIPRVFFEDHVARGCMADTNKKTNDYIVARTKRHIIVELNDADVRELYSDSNHYATSADSFGFDMCYLISSARATRDAIQKQLPEVIAK